MPKLKRLLYTKVMRDERTNNKDVEDLVRSKKIIEFPGRESLGKAISAKMISKGFRETATQLGKITY
jgi:hypothetical protein